MAGVFCFMTKKQIDSSLKKIHLLADQKQLLDASIQLYHLNVNMLRAIENSMQMNPSNKVLKPKDLVKLIVGNIEGDHSQKSIINKKNLKVLKPWIELSDRFFKDMRVNYPKNIHSFYAHNEKIFSLLQMSVVKMRTKT